MGRGPQARSVPQGPAVWLWRRRRFRSDSYSFLVGSESDVRHWGPWPAGLVRPSGPCCFGVAEAPFVKLLAAGGQLRQLVFLQVQKVTLGTGGRGPQARSVPQGPAVWLWRRRRFGSDSYSFLVGSESDVRHWGPWPAGPVRPSGPCCFGVAEAPFVKLLAAGRQLRQLVFL